MSHIVKFSAAKFTNLDILKKAFAKFNWQSVGNVILHPEKRGNITLVQNTVSMEWDLQGDLSMGGIYDTFGRNFEKLQQQYGLEMLEQYVQEKAGTMACETLEDGTIMGEIEMEVML
jgi:hypothetical protein